MLKKIALTALFAITFAVGVGMSAGSSAQASPVAPTEKGLCDWGWC